MFERRKELGPSKEKLLNEFENTFKQLLVNRPDMLEHYNHLIDILKKPLKEKFLLISIGSGSQGSGVQQQIPDYIKNISKTEDVCILLLDGLFEKEGLQNFENQNAVVKKSEDTLRYESQDPNFKLNINVFACYIPNEVSNVNFRQLLTAAITDVLDRGGKVFIANHTQAHYLADIPVVAAVYNDLKQGRDYTDQLQLYTQCASSGVKYYGDKLYVDEKTENEYFEKHLSNYYYSCKKIENLASVSDFSSEVKAAKTIRHE